ncbi:hypothetical protein BDQ17DRAFT_1331697 [Cyathus striatus]|nr:hypothetical protein BDQ17DRAFT_1331697 [Cyathus striatus]
MSAVHLIDLPIKLLEIIFPLLKLHDARSLANCCRYLHEVGQRYTFKYRRLVVKWDPWKQDIPSEFLHRILVSNNSTDPASQLHPSTRYALDTRNVFLEYAAFLLARPDILNHVENIYLSDEIPYYTWGYWGGATPDASLERWKYKFYLSVWDVVRKLLTGARFVKESTLYHIELSKDIFNCFRRLRHLYTLRLDSCFFRKGTISSMCKGRPPVMSSSLLNLDIYMPHRHVDCQEDIWKVLQFFPNLRTLSISSDIDDRAVERPPAKLIEKGTLFSTLEKFVIMNASMEAILGIVEWIRITLQRGFCLRLTHISISTMYDVPPWALESLLIALSYCPMEVLNLDLNYHTPAFTTIREIANKCPNIRGLTLILRKESDETGVVDWMHPSWEYASYFTMFRRLEYFCWNFRTSSSDFSPASMVFFEEGFPHNSEDATTYDSTYSDEPDLFNDRYYIAYPFAANCPTLRIFSILLSDREVEGCDVHRAENGVISLIPFKERTVANKFEYWNAIDEEELQMPHWPRTHPGLA